MIKEFTTELSTVSPKPLRLGVNTVSITTGTFRASLITAGFLSKSYQNTGPSEPRKLQ